ncbi:MAG: DUF1501 domain-containing protein [Pirellulaceae bacterium]
MLNDDPHTAMRNRLSRRQFFGRAGGGIGVAALASLLGSDAQAGDSHSERFGGLAGLPHFTPRARRVIFLFQSGGPSQIDLFDHKPLLARSHGEQLPESIRMGQLLTGMTTDQKEKLVTRSRFKFARHGRCGAELSELLPHTAGVVDDLCIVKSLHTDAINHEQGIMLVQTGSQQPGRPSIGSWLSYGLGSETRNLPDFVVFSSGARPGDQPLSGRLWGSSFLPARHQGTKLRSARDAVLFLSDPPGIDRATRRRMLDGLAELEQLQAEAYGPSALDARLDQYERAFNMQRAIPQLTNLSDEPQHTFDLYGEQAKQPGTFAANCLLARRLIERGTRFVQLFHRGWDHHEKLPEFIRLKCGETDRGAAALVVDLKQRGLLDDTLVVWAGEFGRTVFCQGPLTAGDYGRDHHPRNFTIWMAGGGVKRGATIGRTDDYSYNIVEDPIHVHDLQATTLHLLGIDHERLTYRFQGRDYRLTDVAGNVATKLLA